MANVGQQMDSHSRESASQQRPLLSSFPNPSGYGSHQIPSANRHDHQTKFDLQDHLNTEINPRWGELVLIACFFISGILDAGAYNAYECFCSMQTGNTIFAALGVSDLPVSSPKLAWTKSVTSVTSFLFGSVVIGWFHRNFGQQKRWVLTTSFGIQSILIAVAGVLVWRGHSSGAPTSHNDPTLEIAASTADPGFPWTDLIPIALLAFQAAAKVIASRVLQQGGLPCIVLTTLYTDLISDPNFFSAGLFGNAQRNRRFGGAAFYFIGAVLGGVAAASNSFGFSGALFVAAGIQMLTAVTWLLWRAEKSDHDEAS